METTKREDDDIPESDAEEIKAARKRDLSLSTIGNLRHWIGLLKEQPALLLDLLFAWEEAVNGLDFCFRFRVNGDPMSLPGPESASRFQQLTEVIATWCDSDAGRPIDPIPLLRCAWIRSYLIGDWQEIVRTADDVTDDTKAKWQAAVDEARLTNRRIYNRLVVIGVAAAEKSSQRQVWESRLLHLIDQQPHDTIKKSDRSLAKDVGCSPPTLTTLDAYQTLKNVRLHSAGASARRRGRKTDSGGFEAWESDEAGRDESES